MLKRNGKLCWSSLVALILWLGALPASAAQADTGNQQVNHVDFNNEWLADGELAVILGNGVIYYAAPGFSPGCDIRAPTADTVKIWLSLAQTAMLSGKTVVLGYTECGGYNYINWFTANR